MYGKQYKVHLNNNTENRNEMQGKQYKLHLNNKNNDTTEKKQRITSNHGEARNQKG